MWGTTRFSALFSVLEADFWIISQTTHATDSLASGALLVRRSPSTTSNVGDKGQDVITMLEEGACLPMYVLTTTSSIDLLGNMTGGPAFNAFGGKGKRLGGR